MAGIYGWSLVAEGILWMTAEKSWSSKFYSCKEINSEATLMNLEADSFPDKQGGALAFNRKKWVTATVKECSGKSRHSNFSNAYILPSQVPESHYFPIMALTLVQQTLQVSKFNLIWHLAANEILSLIFSFLFSPAATDDRFFACCQGAFHCLP